MHMSSWICDVNQGNLTANPTLDTFVPLLNFRFSDIVCLGHTCQQLERRFVRLLTLTVKRCFICFDLFIITNNDHLVLNEA